MIPVGLPSALLERRPDIAAAERQAAAANQQIGIAQAAFFPTLTFSVAAGVESTSFINWVTWPARFWTLGPQAAQTLFDAGKRTRHAGPGPGRIRVHRRQLPPDRIDRLSAGGR